MKILLILLFLTSCATFDKKQQNLTSVSKQKQECILKFYEKGMSTDEAIKTCQYVLERKK